MSEGRNSTARWLLAVVAFLIVYGSLFPFRFEDVGASGPIDLLRRLTWARTTPSDIAANVLLYLPFGVCLAWLLAARLGSLLAIAAACVAGAALSTVIEVAQLYETRRVSSLTDIACNTLGAVAGALLAVAVREAQQRLRPPGIEGVLRQPVTTSLVVLWIGYRLAPFAPVLDFDKWRTAVEPLLREPWFQPGPVLRLLLPWLVVTRALHSLQSRGAGLPATLLVMLLVALGLVIVAGKVLTPADLVAMGLALVLAWPLDRLGEERASALLAFGLAALLITAGLEPFNFRLERDVFALAPFRESLARYSALNLPGMFLKCFTVGSLVWLLARAGNGILLATLVGAGLVFAIEVLQLWLPGRSAGITEPLLALAAGGLIALFESGRSAPVAAPAPALRKPAKPRRR